MISHQARLLWEPAPVYVESAVAQCQSFDCESFAESRAIKSSNRGRHVLSGGGCGGTVTKTLSTRDNQFVGEKTLINHHCVNEWDERNCQDSLSGLTEY